ncbi:MAG: efflux RND transporter periplasmic adaptor subunit [Flammeovirgaceae bacterium]
MDRPIQTQVVRQEQVKKWTKIGAILLAVITVIYVANLFLKQSVERRLLRTSFVERGTVEAVITSTGTVIPEYEQIVSSPIDTRVLSILKRAGDSLRKDEAILLLDTQQAEWSYRKVTDQIALKVNSLAQLDYTISNQLIKLNTQIRSKAIDVENKKRKYEQFKQLYANKGIAQNDYEQARVDAETAQNEYEELVETKKNTEQSSKLQKEGLKIEISILQTEQQIYARELSLASTKTERNGIVTWVMQTGGVSVRKGDILAKVADLSSYRVDATVSDVHASQLSIGMPVVVKVDGARESKELRGEIFNILPTIENGIVKLQVRLDDPSEKSLRSNLRVDVFIIKDKKENVLRIKKPVFASKEGRTELFVIKGEDAVKRLVGVGLKGADYYEITDGLAEGEEVIISDVNEFAHKTTLKIK